MGVCVCRFYVHIVLSNRYAREVMGDEKYDTWRVITADEVKAYLGFSILMGIVSQKECHVCVCVCVCVCVW